MKKHYCKCGCGREVGVYQFSSKKLGFIKGQPKQYVSGHNRKNFCIDENESMAEAKIRQSKEFLLKLQDVKKRIGDIIDVDVFWDADENNLHRTVVKKAKIIAEYPKFYLVDAGNYLATQMKVDIARMEG